MTITFADLQGMDAAGLHRVMEQGHPLDYEAMADTRYQGVDLSLPQFVNKLLWKTFRKTFHKDRATGQLRGWNVRVEQYGVDAVNIPMTDKHGKQLTFGHYVVCEAAGKRFPKGWNGPNYLDYGIAGNTFADLARFTYSPLVAVNAGDMSLLLGWEVVRLGPLLVPVPDYWALRYEGQLADEDIMPVPKP